MKKALIMLVVMVMVHVYVLANLRFTAWPEMFSYAYLYNKGFDLYSDFIYPYTPLLTIALAWLYKILGYEVFVQKLLCWMLVAMNDGFVFAGVRKLTKSSTASLLGVLFYMLSQITLEGNMMWFDIAVVTPILAGLVFMVNKKYWWTGIFLGIAMLVKQTAVVYIIFSIAYLVFRKRVRELTRLLAGLTVMVGGLLLWVFASGLWEEFFSWTLKYPLVYWGKFPGYVQMSLSGGEVLILGWAVLPVIAIILRDKLKKESLLLLLFLAAGLVAVYPRWSFFHLQSALAVASVAWGYVFAKRRGLVVVLLVMFGLVVIFSRLQVVAREWRAEDRFYGKEDNELALVIKDRVGMGEKVYLMGIHSGLYSIADMVPPKPWTDNFGWYLEIEGVQDWVIEGWEAEPPEVIVWREPMRGNWFDAGTYQPAMIGNWIEKNYSKEGELVRGVWVWRRK